MNPDDIRYTQSSINGSNIPDLLDSVLGQAPIPPIRVFRKDGAMHTLDHRRLVAHQIAHRNSPSEIQVQRVYLSHTDGVHGKPGETYRDEAKRKTTTQTGGTSIRINGVDHEAMGLPKTWS